MSAEPVYEHRLVYFGEINKYLVDGWEPTPGTTHVIRYIGQIVHTHVWLRRRVAT